MERPEWVFWHSFEPGVASFGLDGVIAEIGLARVRTRLRPAGRRAANAAWSKEFLRDRRMLLIWDNFESVRSMPGPVGGHPAAG